MSDYFRITKKDLNSLAAAVLICLFAFSGFYVAYTYAAEDVKTATLTATVVVSLSFTVTTTDPTDLFGNITAGGSAKFATSTLNVSTNNANGWHVTLYGNNQGSSSASTTMYISPNVYTTSIPDEAEWINHPSATTSAGNAVTGDTLANVLAFRVMTASSTNGIAFISTAWWGTADGYPGGASTLWKGIASSTVQRKIGSTNVPSNGNALNTVSYYLKAAGTQAGGDYTGGLTYTAVTN